jgi:diguanylate cyclase (GGDEF)-like protein
MDSNLPGPDLNEILSARIREIQQDLDLLVNSGRWLVWCCIVRGPFEYGREWLWEFLPDFCKIPPVWFDVERLDNQAITQILCRSRLPEDNLVCNMLSDKALRECWDGYSHMFRVRLRDGRISWVEENVTIQVLPDGSRQLMGIVTDATERKRAEERLQNLQEELVANQEELIAQNGELVALRDRLEQEKHFLAEANTRLENLATTDGLTGIKNHRAFQGQLDTEWNSAVRYQRPLSLVILDIDHFKPFNDAYGHPAGDDVLKQVARILERTVRNSDCLARYGGEEFVVILPETDTAGALSLADRFRSNIESHRWARRTVTATVGVTTLSPIHADAQTLIIEADRALYQAKSDGRNCVRHAAAIASTSISR